MPRRLCALVIAGFASLAGAATYTDSKGGFSLTYPSGYTVRTDFPNVNVAIAGPPSNGFAPNITVVVGAAQGATLTQIVQGSASTLKKLFTNFTVVSQTPATVGGQAGRELVYTYRQGQFDLRQKQRYVIRNGKVYVLTQSSLKADPKADAALGPILNSFKFGR